MPEEAKKKENLPKEVKEVSDLLEELNKKIDFLPPHIRGNPFSQLLKIILYPDSSIKKEDLPGYGLALYEAVYLFIRSQHEAVEKKE